MIGIMPSDCFNRLRELSDAPRKWQQNEAVFRRDDLVRYLYLVTDGEVALQRDTASGSRLVLQRAIAGNLLAEGSIASSRYHCDAVAVVDTTIAPVSIDRLRNAMASDQELTESWMTLLARQLQRSRAQAEILRMKGVGQRLDAWLDLNHGKLPARGRRRSLADEIGVSPEALYRELARRRDPQQQSTSRPRTSASLQTSDRTRPR